MRSLKSTFLLISNLVLQPDYGSSTVDHIWLYAFKLGYGANGKVREPFRKRSYQLTLCIDG
jgi:hypothetical protein